MRGSANRPVLIRKINLWWYAVALVPLLALGWLAATNIVPAIFLPIVLFLFVFWLSSFVFAVFGKLRAPRPESRQ